MHTSEYRIPILNIRYMLTCFKLNLASQSYIEDEVPSLKKLLTYSKKEDIVPTATKMINELFARGGLDLDIDVYIEDNPDKASIYYLHIEIKHEDDTYESKLTINDNFLVDDSDIHKRELQKDRVY